MSVQKAPQFGQLTGNAVCCSQKMSLMNLLSDELDHKIGCICLWVSPNYTSARAIHVNIVVVLSFCSKSNC